MYVHLTPTKWFSLSHETSPLSIGTGGGQMANKRRGIVIKDDYCESGIRHSMAIDQL